MKITITSGTPAQKAVRDPDKDMTVCCTAGSGGQYSSSSAVSHPVCCPRIF